MTRIPFSPFFLVSCMLLFAGTNIHAQSQSRHINWLFTDVGALIINVDGRTVGYGAGALGSLALLSLLDEAIQTSPQKGISRQWRNFARVGNLPGEPLFAIPTSLGMFGISLLTGDRYFQDAAFTAAQSLLYASSATLVLKWIVGRHRPNQSSSAYAFDPFSSPDAFPSGHATAAFAMLTPWVIYYPHWMTWTLAGLTATSTAFARVALNKHWFTDTFAGAIIGTSMGWVLSRRHMGNVKNQASTSSLFITPIFTPQNHGMALALRF